jgi:flagellar hook protein FlgE
MSSNGQNIDGFSTAVSGLNAQQSKLELVGNNIANINTIGYKSTRMTFAEQFGSTIGISFTPFKQAGFQTTGNVTDLGINGNSFFILNKNDKQYFTRDGSFFFNKDGVFVNGQGFSVQGWEIDPKDKTKKSDVFGDIVIDQNLMAEAQSTKNVHLTGNLNAGLNPENEVWSSVTPLTFIDDDMESVAVEESEINSLTQTTSPFLDGETLHILGTDRDGNEISSSFIFGDAYDGTNLGDLLGKINEAFGKHSTVQLSDGKILLSDVETGESQTSIKILSDDNNMGDIDFPGFANIASGYTPIVKTSMVVYDALGKAHELTVQYEKTGNPSEWKVMFGANGSETVSSGGSGILTFNENGNYQSFEYEDGSSEFVLDPGNNAPLLNININMNSNEGFTGLTQFDSVSSLSLRSQDGSQAGILTGFKVDEAGIIKGLFSNGDIIDLAQVGTAKFKNVNGLRQEGGSLFIESKESGPSEIDIADENESSIESGVLEMSNVDLANQFTQMIEAQRGFQAASRVVTTLNEVMDEASRLKR